MSAISSFLDGVTRAAAAGLAPWASLYADSVLVSTAAAFLHLGGMLVGGGLALATDREALRLAPHDEAERGRFLEHLRSIHRPVAASLGVVALSGAAMLAADVEALARSPVLWTKAVLVLALLANGWWMTRVEARLRASAAVDVRAWRRLRTTAVASSALWLTVLFTGALLRAG